MKLRRHIVYIYIYIIYITEHKCILNGLRSPSASSYKMQLKLLL